MLWAGLSKQKVLGSRRSATASGLVCGTLFIPYAFPPQLEEHLWSTMVLSALRMCALLSNNTMDVALQGNNITVKRKKELCPRSFTPRRYPASWIGICRSHEYDRKQGAIGTAHAPICASSGLR